MKPDFRDARGWSRVVLAVALGVALAWAIPAGASPVRIHQVNSQAGFAAGTLEGVRIDARGVLSLAADVDTVAQVPEPFAFAVAALPDGWAVGTGGEGRVLKVGRDGTVSVLFDAPESNVFALHADADGTLFVGTSPAGKVYRAPEMFADPHFQAREAIVEVETERFGKLKMQNVVPRLSETPSAIRTPAPSKVGQHNADVYGGLLGLTPKEIEELKAAGAI